MCSLRRRFLCLPWCAQRTPPQTKKTQLNYQHLLLGFNELGNSNT